MNTLYLKLVMIASLRGSCGAGDGTKGFFSDANICRPIENEAFDPTDILAGHFAIPAITTGVTRNAQLTTVETTKKSVWGAEMWTGFSSISRQSNPTATALRSCSSKVSCR